MVILYSSSILLFLLNVKMSKSNSNVKKAISMRACFLGSLYCGMVESCIPEMDFRPLDSIFVDPNADLSVEECA